MAQFPGESSDGSFKRQEDAFRRIVGESLDLPVVPGRYHLYVSLACPWAHRTLIVRRLLGLQDSIGVSIADPVRDERGWAFREGPGHGPDEAEGFHFLAEAYLATDPSVDGRVTVPVLWDRLEKKIVNNSEDDICRMFQDAFAPPVVPNLFPAVLADEQAELSNFLYEKVNNGVYLAGFATEQGVYEKAVRELFEALDTLEKRLSSSRYLLGDRIVESDWRLFCTLVRFDAVYHGHFKCNLKRIIDYPSLHRHLCDLYLQPGIAETVNLDHIKRHYYITHDDINPTGIVPVGPAVIFGKGIDP
jgi:putative glutathione S-transferase